MNTRVGMVYGVVPSRNNVWSVWRPVGCAVVAYTRLRGVVGVISWSHESLEDLEESLEDLEESLAGHFTPSRCSVRVGPFLVRWKA